MAKAGDNVKKFFMIIVAFFSLLSFSTPSFPQNKILERVRTPGSIPGWGTPLAGGVSIAEYYIAPGDELQIYVWQNADLSRKVTVMSDGRINYPVIGSIQAADLTIEQLQEKIKNALSAYARSKTQYRIAPGDQLDIDVWKNEDLSKTVMVMPDGKISYPFLGTIQAGGLTLEQLQEKIKSALSRYAVSKAEYRITAGDQIEIFVWKHPDISKDVTVMPDGKISCPLIGIIDAAGLTVKELQEKIKDNFFEYIRFPDVTVSVTQMSKDKIVKVSEVNAAVRGLSARKPVSVEDIIVEIVSSAGNKVMIFGEVNNEGVYLYNGKINVLEAIAMAGGITNDGQRDSIIVVSDNFTDSPKVRRVNLLRAIRKGTSRHDFILKPNDVLYVPRTFIADFNKFLGELEPAMSRGWQMFDWRDRIRVLYKHFYKTFTSS